MQREPNARPHSPAAPHRLQYTRAILCQILLLPYFPIAPGRSPSPTSLPRTIQSQQWAVYTQVTQIHPYQTNLSCLLANQSCKTFPNATFFHKVKMWGVCLCGIQPPAQLYRGAVFLSSTGIHLFKLLSWCIIPSATKVVGGCLSGTPPPTV